MVDWQELLGVIWLLTVTLVKYLSLKLHTRIFVSQRLSVSYAMSDILYKSFFRRMVNKYFSMSMENESSVSYGVTHSLKLSLTIGSQLPLYGCHRLAPSDLRLALSSCLSIHTFFYFRTRGEFESHSELAQENSDGSSEFK